MRINRKKQKKQTKKRKETEPMMLNVDFMLRLLVAGILGAIIGLDREYRAKEDLDSSYEQTYQDEFDKIQSEYKKVKKSSKKTV